MSMSAAQKLMSLAYKNPILGENAAQRKPTITPESRSPMLLIVCSMP